MIKHTINPRTNLAQMHFFFQIDNGAEFELTFHNNRVTVTVYFYEVNYTLIDAHCPIEEITDTINEAYDFFDVKFFNHFETLLNS